MEVFDESYLLEIYTYSTATIKFDDKALAH